MNVSILIGLIHHVFMQIWYIVEFCDEWWVWWYCWSFLLLQVEGKHSDLGCYYLSENLDVNDDYTFWVQKDDEESIYDLPHALPGGDFFCDGK